MHLLQLNNNGEFSLTEVHGKQIPQYAILSHTWIANHEEVTFKDVTKGRGKDKAGYRKLYFCAKQAADDGLRHFWVDTCCIDKSSSAELQEAINSMFRWYERSAKCYVYLADVFDWPSRDTSVEHATTSHQTWRLEFHQSRWFTRGWTLQELLAPKSVDFFSANGERLGDRFSLAADISGITGIPFKALQGNSSFLFQFKVEERLRWAANRETTREEDAAYSLLGLFDLHIPLLYGEGRVKAFKRLHRERESVVAWEKSHGMDFDLLEDPSHRSAHEDDAESQLLQAKRPNLLKRTNTETFPNTSTNDTERTPQKRRLLGPYSDDDSVSTVPEMQKWWDETLEKRMGPLDGYATVTVVLIKWADAIDDFQTHSQACFDSSISSCLFSITRTTRVYW
jgi:hypothetical protein